MTVFETLNSDVIMKNCAFKQHRKRTPDPISQILLFSKTGVGALRMYSNIKFSGMEIRTRPVHSRELLPISIKKRTDEGKIFLVLSLNFLYCKFVCFSFLHNKNPVRISSLDSNYAPSCPLENLLDCLIWL